MEEHNCRLGWKGIWKLGIPSDLILGVCFRAVQDKRPPLHRCIPPNGPCNRPCGTGRYGTNAFLSCALGFLFGEQLLRNGSSSCQYRILSCSCRSRTLRSAVSAGGVVLPGAETGVPTRLAPSTCARAVGPSAATSPCSHHPVHTRGRQLRLIGLLIAAQSHSAPRRVQVPSRGRWEQQNSNLKECGSALS